MYGGDGLIICHGFTSASVVVFFNFCTTHLSLTQTLLYPAYNSVCSSHCCSYLWKIQILLWFSKIGFILEPWYFFSLSYERNIGLVQSNGTCRCMLTFINFFWKSCHGDGDYLHSVNNVVMRNFICGLWDSVAVNWVVSCSLWIMYWRLVLSPSCIQQAVFEQERWRRPEFGKQTQGMQPDHVYSRNLTIYKIILNCFLFILVYLLILVLFLISSVNQGQTGRVFKNFTFFKILLKYY